MKPLTKWLMVIAAVELVGVGLWAAWRPSGQPQDVVLPLIDLQRLDAISAEEIKRQYRQTDWSSAESLVRLAELYVLHGYFPEAERVAQLAGRLEPHSYAAQLWWGIALDRLGRMEEAITHLKRAAPLAVREGDRQRCWYYTGRNYLRLERPAEAEAAFQQASPYAPAEYELTKLLFRTGRFEECLQRIDRLLSRFPNEHILLQLKGRILLSRNRLTEAEDLFELAERSPQIIELDGLTQFLMKQEGRVGMAGQIAEAERLTKAGEGEKAIPLLLECLKARWSTSAVVSLIIAYPTTGAYQPAIALCEEYLKREGPYPGVLFFQAKLYQQIGENEKARQNMLLSVQLRSTIDAHRLLSQLYRQEKNEQAAARHEALADEAEAIDAFWKNELQRTVALLEKTVARLPQRERAWLFLADARRFLGQKEKAAEAYQRCLQINPDNSRALRGMRRLKQDGNNKATAEKQQAKS